ncbi:amino acid adenylation domain-containing protein [Nocardioides sp. TRM66260-LWL]|uniref:Pls/PosA family non-ribosomal peptide synthetase n=1 Tax=Nocardioides sp. TRM66260-LWL TaxID=2874478 RepID=UPI001CC5E4F3|nr:Pls/PosA family non-ribosomal peptide synthetase [Nocardioides sp. TRM66260-LWL]MBZ5735893.1 amino acid adenylation domain-containing protein [Nocardioides sp. TRM66260-LWL]
MVFLDYRADELLPLQPARTLTDLFTDVARAHPRRPALSLPDRDLSYAELDAWTDEIAGRLRAAGAGPGERIGVRITSGTAELYAGILAVLKAGAAYVPVDAEDPEERIAAVLDGADVLGVLTDGLALEVRRAGRAGREKPGAAVEPADDAWVIFTSGTTGTPKGVAITHASATAFVRAEHRLWDVRPEDRVLAGLSVSFDASCEEIWTAWSNGAALVPVPRSVVRAGVEMGPWIRERGVTVVSTVPTLAALWQDDVLEGLRLVILGGEALPDPLAHRLATSCEVWNTYGPTEATVVSTAARVVPGEPVSIGRPLEGWLTALVDEEGRAVPPGSPGELVIGGVGLGRYLDPGLDRVRYAPLPHLGWERGYRSGDMAVETPAGYAFLGRRDDQVKIGGRRIELGEVDAHLAAVPGVAAAAAAVRRSENGNPLLVGYVVAQAGVVLDLVAVRRSVAARTSGGVAPLVVLVDALPQRSSGKVDRAALPWPPPERVATAAEDGADPGLSATAAWLASIWRTELGPLQVTADSDFFDLGGSSLIAARMVTAVRERFPRLAIADVYRCPRLGLLAAHLDELDADAGQAVPDDATSADPEPTAGGRPAVVGALQIVGLGGVLALRAAPWFAGLLLLGDVAGLLDVSSPLPRAAWWVLVPLLALLGTTPGRLLVGGALRRALLPRLEPGVVVRRSRHSGLGLRLWLLEAVGSVLHLERLAGTPWAARWARVAGVDVGPGAHLATLPSLGALVTVGAAATLEEEVDLLGWHVEGAEIVAGPIVIGAGARIARRAMLHPGVRIGEGAEVEPAAVVTGDVPAGERWSGAVARRVGRAGDDWPVPAAAAEPAPGGRRAFAAAVLVREGLPWLCALPGLALVLSGAVDTLGGELVGGPLLAVGYLVLLALGTALAVRLAGRRVRPGWQRTDAPAAAARWLAEGLMNDATHSLFALFSSSLTRRWLTWCGITVGRGTEVSTASGLNRLVSYGDLCFSTDAIGFATGRTRDGWTELRPVSVGARSFLGNTATVPGGTSVGSGCLVGLQSVPPARVPDGSTWLGVPAFELPRTPVDADPSRTLFPSRRVRALRRVFDVVRLVVPAVLLAWLASLLLDLAAVVDERAGLGVLLLVGPLLLGAVGGLGVAVTIVLKWLLIGRYRVGSHPFFSTFVWRDELLNSCQEMVAGPWLLRAALGTPVVNLYLRLMGARVGRGAYVGTLATYEFDQVVIGVDAAVNRAACVQTHLFQDRVMQIGPAVLGDGASVGPHSAILLDTVVGPRTHVGLGSVLMRGEALPEATRWAGVPIARQA